MDRGGVTCASGLAGALAVGFGLLMAACAEEATPDPAAHAEGRAIAETFCASCHAIGWEDESRHADAPPFRELSHNYPIAALRQPLLDGLIVPHPEMPVFRFQPEEVDALIGYLEHIQVPQET